MPPFTTTTMLSQTNNKIGIRYYRQNETFFPKLTQCVTPLPESTGDGGKREKSRCSRQRRSSTKSLDSRSEAKRL